MAEFISMTSVDGVITRTEDARIPVLDRGFLYGDSVYEVFRTYQAVPLFYDEHWSRMENSARLISMVLGYSKPQMRRAIKETIAATGAPALKRDVYVRYTVTRGEGPVDLNPHPDTPTRCVVIVKAIPEWDPIFYSRGVNLAIPTTRRNPVHALDPNIKGGNYLNNVLGLMEARELGADDCVMLGKDGAVTEASNSNVFFVIDDELVTPGSGNLRGLTKEAVHRACAQQGLTTVERSIDAAELPRAAECFLTSATREVMPAHTLRLSDGEMVTFPEGGGETTRRVAGFYRAFVDRYVEEHAALAIF
jgi:branched-chain amino acid aminotransferase